MVDNSKLEENVSLESIVKELENKNPEDIKRIEKITSRWWTDKNKIPQETFYILKGYLVPIIGYKVFIGESSNENDGKKKSLGFRIKVFRGKKIIKRRLEDSSRIKSIYESIDAKFKKYEEKKKKEDYLHFFRVIKSLISRKPEYWKRDEGERVSIPKNLRATSFFVKDERYSTKIDGLKIILEERVTQIGDLLPNGMPYPHPFSGPSIDYKMRIMEKGKIIKIFEGEDYTPFISSLIRSLREYPLSPKDKIARNY